MFFVNISCAVCKAAFKDGDTIYSTTCGHIFHYRCFNVWRSKSTSCPVCRAYNPENHPLYLNFENGLEFEKVVNDLKAKLACYEEKNKQNQEEMDKKVKKIDDVKRLYNISEQWRAELQDKIQRLKQQNEKYWEKLANKSEETEMLKTHIDVLEKDNSVESINQNYKELILENLKLKKNLAESETQRIMLNQKNEIQEQRLQYVTLELEKQFSEGFKKESKLESLEKSSVLKPRNRRRVQKPKSNGNEKFEEAKKVSVETLSNLNMKAKVNRKENKPFHLTQPNDCRVVIVDFPTVNIDYSLKYTVVVLASKMAITLTSEDILKVEILNPKNRRVNAGKVILIAEFKNIEIKTQFLKFANRLKSDLTTASIKIKEYIDENIYPIFMYANRKLRGNVYEYIACKENKVIAKKKLTDTEEIVINDRNHVDTILRSHLNPTLDITNSAVVSNNDSYKRNILDHIFSLF